MIKLIIYYLNKLLIIVGIISVIYTGVMIIADSDSWDYWLIYSVTCLAATILSIVLFIWRKNKFPAPGKDYL